MEIAYVGAPGEHDLLDPDDEHPGFIASDNRGRQRRMNKRGGERQRY